jgi:hypothetical protein
LPFSSNSIVADQHAHDDNLFELPHPRNVERPAKLVSAVSGLSPLRELTHK